METTLPSEKLRISDGRNDNFAPYVWWKNFLNESELRNLLSLFDYAKMSEGKIGQQTLLDKKIRQSKIQFIDEKENRWIYDKLEMAYRIVNDSKYKFDLSGFESQLQLTEYNENDYYHWHTDSGKGVSSLRKLSISVQLSDPTEYEGGELQFLNANEYTNAPKEKGTAILFPSYTAHRVLPITYGCRRSIVAWVIGPPYR